MSTSVIMDTGEVSISDTCQAVNSIIQFFFFLLEKGLQNDNMSTRVSARQIQPFPPFYALAEKGLRNDNMSTRVSARRKRHEYYLNTLHI